jgi:hypothetical protein
MAGTEPFAAVRKRRSWHQAAVQRCPLLRRFVGGKAEMLQAGPIRLLTPEQILALWPDCVMPRVPADWSAAIRYPAMRFWPVKEQEQKMTRERKRAA